MKKRLILLLNDYPYNTGEYPFIKTELKHLIAKFDVSIMCKSIDKEHDHEPVMELPEGVKLYNNRMHFSAVKKLVSLISFIFSKEKCYN